MNLENKNAELEMNVQVTTTEQLAIQYINNLDVEKAKIFILNGESSGNQEIDTILNNSSEKAYYLIEEKIESLRSNKNFNRFYEKHYEEQIDSTQQSIVKMLGKQ